MKLNAKWQVVSHFYPLVRWSPAAASRNHKLALPSVRRIG
jgi:hypothetical protein